MMVVITVITVIALFCCILCLGNTMNKNASRFEKVFFSIMSVVFLILSVVIQVGVTV